IRTVDAGPHAATAAPAPATPTLPPPPAAEPAADGGVPALADAGHAAGADAAVADAGAVPDAGSPATPSTPTPTPTPTAAPPPVRLAVIGDFVEDTAEEGAVAALVKSWKPDAVITLGDDNYPQGAAATIDANIGKYYGDFIGSYKGK